MGRCSMYTGFRLLLFLYFFIFSFSPILFFFFFVSFQLAKIKNLHLQNCFNTPLMAMAMLTICYISLNVHAQPCSGAICLIFGWTLCVLPSFICANSEGSGKTAWMRRLAWAFAGRLCDTYHYLLSISLCWAQVSIWAATWQNQQNDRAPSEDSDGPGLPPSLTKSLLCAQWVAKDSSFLHADSEDSD